jgi:hypothetical protein
VLPDAFMTRSKPEWNVVFDPVSLRMKSCMGWSEQDLLDMRAWISEESRTAGGKAGDYWWFFPRKR